MVLGTLSLVLLVVAAGLAVGQLRGGTLGGVRVGRLRALPLALVAVVLQVLLGLPLPRPGTRLPVLGALLVASLLLLAVTWANRSLPGMVLVAFGILANLLVVVSNGGMPISPTAMQRAGIAATRPTLRQLGPKYVPEETDTRLAVLDARLAVPALRTVVSAGDVVAYAGLLLLVQGLMVPGARGRLSSWLRRATAGRDSGRPGNARGATVQAVPSTAAPLRASAGVWVVLLRVAWLAIALGLLLQLALLLAAVQFQPFAGIRPLTAETARNVCWSVIVCTGIAFGRGAARGRLPVMGVAGLLAAPLALDAANMLQKGVAEALHVVGPTVGLAPLGVMVIKAAEYGSLATALGWIGRQAWGGATAHAVTGLLTGIVFGAVTLALTARPTPKPLPPGTLVVRGVNELVFPVGCALVIYAADVLGKHLAAASTLDQHEHAAQDDAGLGAPDGTAGLAEPVAQAPGVTFAQTGEQHPFPFRVGVRLRPVILSIGPGCHRNEGHWACITHGRGFTTQARCDRHTRRGEHCLVWLCWAHGPEQPSQDLLTATPGDGPSAAHTAAPGSTPTLAALPPTP